MVALPVLTTQTSQPPVLRDILLLRANAGAGLPLPAGSVHCVVTSPPYFGPRDYDCAPVIWGGDPACVHEWTPQRHTPQPHGDDGRQSSGLEGGTGTQAATRFGQVRAATCNRCGAWYGQLGQEPTVELYVEHLVLVFREVWRVLRDDGVVFLNLGDSYAGSGSGPTTASSSLKGVRTQEIAGEMRAAWCDKPRTPPTGYKRKDLMLVPYRVAIALQADGWWVRAIAPWVKRNAMPESVRDRPGVAHEDILILTKSERYFWDQDAVKFPQTGNAHARGSGATPKGFRADRGIDRGSNSFQLHTADKVTLPGGRNRRTSDWYFESLDLMIEDARDHLRDLCHLRDEGGVLANSDNLPLIFDIKTKGYKGAHYATFPTALVEPMIEAATSERGCCPVCGAPWARVVVKPDFSRQPKRGASKLNGHQCTHNDGYLTSAGGAWQDWRDANPDVQTGWRPTCNCGAPAGWLPDDGEVISTPTGVTEHEDPSMVTGRAGFNRPRNSGEGTRPITRYEQRRYAEQLRASPHRAEMEDEAGPAFAHYTRTDRSGARPVPQGLLDKWIADGWIERVAVPAWRPPELVPCVVLDPFGGTGTVGIAAATLGRRAVIVDLSETYLKQARGRALDELFGVDAGDLEAGAAGLQLAIWEEMA